MNDDLDADKLMQSASEVMKLNEKIAKTIKGKDFAVRMSAMGMTLAKLIMEEAEDYTEALAYAARTMATLVEVIDNETSRKEFQDPSHVDDAVH